MSLSLAYTIVLKIKILSRTIYYVDLLSPIGFVIQPRTFHSGRTMPRNGLLFRWGFSCKNTGSWPVPWPIYMGSPRWIRFVFFFRWYRVYLPLAKSGWHRNCRWQIESDRHKVPGFGSILAMANAPGVAIQWVYVLRIWRYSYIVTAIYTAHLLKYYHRLTSYVL